ncbi:TPA: ogr/Delta-like zinc finger family protein [Neisseria meningitidis]|uniref:ogr/Delta-like zinc finger family protein n=1 Tax=Neisseria meningitidis TaxID=487 RepID=UPI0021F0D453|nr:ogr/Delta-like zinc finger family protein [Neisseria meningitidis]MCV6751909.1 ogr/Delta-like zinc finger family protein [Neisseria meningitidis]MCV6760070.1 ogr/Delta-like zinc finger family protein [Neisseria meningitidis]MCV6775110.1 ogr/Delta-like zinc finger family protein [Neisseria meningitidis]
MNRRSITKAERGNMRVQINCPCCGSGCKVTASRRMTDRSRHSSVQCLNSACGWTGIAATEVIRTVSPPSPMYQDPALIPPAMSAAEIAAHEGGTEQKELI